MRQLFKIDESEKRRILEMHENAIRKNYLIEAPEANKSGCGINGTGEANYESAKKFAGGDFCPAVRSTQPWGILGKFMYNKKDNRTIDFYFLTPTAPNIYYTFTLQDNTNKVGQPNWEFQNLNNFKVNELMGATIGSGADFNAERAKDFVSGLNNVINTGFGKGAPKELTAQYIIVFMNSYGAKADSSITGPMVNSLRKVGDLSKYPDAKTVADAVLPQTQQPTQPTQPQTGRQ